jgi:hypothetical protein
MLLFHRCQGHRSHPNRYVSIANAPHAPFSLSDLRSDVPLLCIVVSIANAPHAPFSHIDGHGTSADDVRFNSKRSSCSFFTAGCLAWLYRRLREVVCEAEASFAIFEGFFPLLHQVYLTFVALTRACRAISSLLKSLSRQRAWSYHHFVPR